MTIRYCKTGDYWYDLDTYEIDGRPGEFHSFEPQRLSHTNTIIKDHADYKSPVTGEVISGRVQRREHMKRHNLREVDNTEHRPVYRNPDFIRKHGISQDRMGDPIQRPVHTGYDRPPPGVFERLMRK